jgi:putative phosphoribosyl transferase
VRVTFQDRGEAGRVLAGRLAAYSGRTDVVVLGLARGGVPVAREIATALRTPVDVFVVRKLGVPRWRELAMGAVATGASMLAAVRAVRLSDPTRVVVAVPVAPRSVDRRLVGEADEIICAVTPQRFEAVGQVFGDFHQITDEEVREALAGPHAGD